MCVTFVTCEVRVCGPRCHSGSSLYIYRVYYRTPKVTEKELGTGGAEHAARSRDVVPREHALPLEELEGLGVI